MAWHEDRTWIARHRLADRARCLAIAAQCRYLAVGAGLAWRDGADQREHALMKWRYLGEVEPGVAQIAGPSGEQRHDVVNDLLLLGPRALSASRLPPVRLPPAQKALHRG